EGGQQGLGAFFFDDLGDDRPGDRLDVGAVGRLRVGHDRGRVGVDQHDLVALFAQGLARLGAGIVELASLADDDGAGADQEDFLEVGTFRHGAREVRGTQYSVLSTQYTVRSFPHWIDRGIRWGGEQDGLEIRPTTPT